MTPAVRAATWTGLSVLVLHTAIALWIFAEVHSSREQAQAGFAWFLLMELDKPTTYLAYDYVARTELLRMVTNWGDEWGDGRNLRSLVLHGVLGGVQWFAVGWVAGYVLWVLAKVVGKRNLTAGR